MSWESDWLLGICWRHLKMVPHFASTPCGSTIRLVELKLTLIFKARQPCSSTGRPLQGLSDALRPNGEHLPFSPRLPIATIKSPIP